MALESRMQSVFRIETGVNWQAQIDDDQLPLFPEEKPDEIVFLPSPAPTPRPPNPSDDSEAARDHRRARDQWGWRDGKRVPV